MAFSTRRGRPPKTHSTALDFGTPELRLKHALGATAEPIDLCLEKALINESQHRAGLHLRWLYTLRYGAPSITTRYIQNDSSPGEEDPSWRYNREREYLEASRLLKAHQRYEPVMRLAIFNEPPLCLSAAMRHSSLIDVTLATRIEASWRSITEGFDLLLHLWEKPNTSQPMALSPQRQDLNKIVH